MNVAEQLRAQPRIVDAVCEGLHQLGVREVFGVIGGAVLPLHDALMRSPLKLRHFQHEGGAAYAAVEASLAGKRPVVVLTTTGPGLTNALTGLISGRFEGASVIVLSGHTGPSQRGRFPLQETSMQTLPSAGLFSAGPYFDVGWAPECANEIRIALRQIAAMAHRPEGFVGHLALSLNVQAESCEAPTLSATTNVVLPGPASIDAAVEALNEAPFAVWVGHGARRDVPALREFLARTRAPYFSTPRGKGLVDETGDGYLGVTGFGGHEGVGDELRRLGVQRVLVLGTRLGEASCFYEAALCPPGGLVHVDIDPKIPGAAYPMMPVVPVQGHIGPTLAAMTDRVAPVQGLDAVRRRRAPKLGKKVPGRVRPEYLLQRLQALVVEGSDALVMTGVGNAMCWGNNRLSFRTPGRYRVPGVYCPTGHITSGAVGAALAQSKRVVALVGDGALMMNNEFNTAARYGADVTWVVLNDSCLGMVEKGMRGLGYDKSELSFPEVNFEGIAKAMGCNGVIVTDETLLDAALSEALERPGPNVVDVRVVTETQAPLGGRNKSLDKQTGGF